MACHRHHRVRSFRQPRHEQGVGRFASPTQLHPLSPHCRTLPQRRRHHNQPAQHPHRDPQEAADSRPVLTFTVRALLPKLAGTGLSVVLLDKSEDGARPNGVDVVSTLGEMIKFNLSHRKVSDHNGDGTVGRERLWQDNVATVQSPPC